MSQSEGPLVLVMLRNRDELDNRLKQAFAQGVRWAIERPSLNALSELGLSVDQIAVFFRRSG